MIWLLFLLCNVVSACTNDEDCLNDGTCITSGEYVGECKCPLGYMGHDCSGFGCENEFKCDGHFVGDSNGCYTDLVEETANLWQCKSDYIYSDRIVEYRDTSKIFTYASFIDSSFDITYVDTIVEWDDYHGQYKTDYFTVVAKDATGLGDSYVKNRIIFDDRFPKSVCGSPGYESVSGNRKVCNRFKSKHGICHGKTVQLCDKKCNNGFEGPDCNICTGCESCSGEYFEKTAKRVFMKKDFIIKNGGKTCYKVWQRV